MKRSFTVVIEKDQETDMYVGEVPGLPVVIHRGKQLTS